jgi:hypothetical protein
MEKEIKPYNYNFNLKIWINFGWPKKTNIQNRHRILESINSTRSDTRLRGRTLFNVSNVNKTGKSQKFGLYYGTTNWKTYKWRTGSNISLITCVFCDLCLLRAINITSVLLKDSILLSFFRQYSIVMQKAKVSFHISSTYCPIFITIITKKLQINMDENFTFY